MKYELFFHGPRAVIYPKLIELHRKQYGVLPRAEFVETFHSLAVYFLGQDKRTAPYRSYFLGLPDTVDALEASILDLANWAIESRKRTEFRRLLPIIANQSFKIDNSMTYALKRCVHLDFEFTVCVITRIPLYIKKLSKTTLALRIKELNILEYFIKGNDAEEADLKTELNELLGEIKRLEKAEARSTQHSSDLRNEIASLSDKRYELVKKIDQLVNKNRISSESTKAKRHINFEEFLRLRLSEPFPEIVEEAYLPQLLARFRREDSLIRKCGLYAID